MSLSDRVFHPFETLVRPLEIPFRPLPSDGPLALLLHFARMCRGALIAILLLSMATEACNLAVIWGISRLVDGVTTQGAAAFVESHMSAIVAFGVLFFPVMPLLAFLCNTLGSEVISVSLSVLMQWHGHKAVERQDLAFFHDLFAGQVATRIAQVASAIKQQLAVAAWVLPNFIVQVTGSLILVAAISWPLAIPVLVWAVANLFVARKAVPLFSDLARRTAKTRSRVVGTMADLYSNIQTVKLFSAEDSEAGAIRKALGKSLAAQHTERRVMLTADITIITLNVLLLLSTCIVGIWGMTASFVTLGDFVASITIAQRLSSNARAFLNMGQQIFEAIGTIRDAMPVMTTPPTIRDAPDAHRLEVTHGEIRFEALRFEYQKDQRVIRDLSLIVKAGEKIGVVGLSGAGKTTLVSLLLRFFDLEGGRILIDEQDITRVTQASLRDAIGVITQDVSLLHRSVGDNILYGRPGASRQEMENAARLAQADTFIPELKDSEGRSSYDAYVGDRGIKLSGGQRQRVAIARVLLKDAPILVLDEATSALDSEAEAAIQQNLDLLMENKTVIAIAHRLSTISQMDRIVVLDKGRIVEEGRPDELLAMGGLYARLWNRQTGGYIADREEAL
ncbi:ABC transporter ATP-binding protein [Rhizobium sp. NRK18]|uniref:ABC transporter ATP-binding protein n=1 Tax=Rhizobium sp. NRK18 TaxID=2964667 RepID=UPI0021C32D3F|nr:ABC transporter ATP-binding protein [Rhizobium sp. NRK18]MCQ2004680.1 ABC transporter ATP-binding protein/permease [Rhizobium sp. NRK18]